MSTNNVKFTRTQAIKAFLLKINKHSDLSNMYNYNMEVQVKVAQEDGRPAQFEFKGKNKPCWTNGLETWKDFRIPYNAKTEPEYTDKPMSFNLDKYVEGIGMTGWDWVKRCSRWVAFDFDAILGHSEKHTKKLSQEQLVEIQQIVHDVPWVTLRKSTSGKGLHLYVFLHEIPTANHTEHAALARAILHMLSSLTGYPFVSKVDTCGGNMWIWHRKMIGTDGLDLLKEGQYLQNLPQNWKDHIPVVSGKQTKSTPCFLKEIDTTEDLFQELTGQRARVPLDQNHRKLIEYLQNENCRYWFDEDHHMLVTHTFHLLEAHKSLDFRGEFKTISKGENYGNDHNCFCFPLRYGAWVVRRYSAGTAEADTWDIDAKGYTRCFLNKELDLDMLCKINKGVEKPKGGYHFDRFSDAQRVLFKLGCNFTFPVFLQHRNTTLSQHKVDKSKVILQIVQEKSDSSNDMEGWLLEKNIWTRVFKIKIPELIEETNSNCDDIIRHLVTEDGENCGWVIKAQGNWNNEPIAHVDCALAAIGYKGSEIRDIKGNNTLNPWILTNIPFDVEYPGDRKWNRDCAKLNYIPSIYHDNLTFPTWKKILNHLGQNLNDTVQQNQWCQQNNIQTGADYLFAWIASLIKMPTRPLPYLFLYSEQQNTGKSTLHEALGKLICKGYKRADNALINSQGFNGELQNAVLCAIEETDLRKNKEAYSRIKDWVTAKTISIHIKGSTPFIAINTTHWIQCSNYSIFCPVEFGDTRIVIIKVNPLKPEDLIPKYQLEILLEKEAPDFLSAILNYELPVSNDRLNLPVIETEQKKMILQQQKSTLQQFLEEKVKPIEGHYILMHDFWERFQEFVDQSEIQFWSKHRLAKELPTDFPRGKISAGPDNGKTGIGNITWIENDVIPLIPFYLKNQVLRNTPDYVTSEIKNENNSIRS